jgi:hypothetical protein
MQVARMPPVLASYCATRSLEAAPLRRDTVLYHDHLDNLRTRKLQLEQHLTQCIGEEDWGQIEGELTKIDIALSFLEKLQIHRPTGLPADSGDCGQGFRLNTTMHSDRRRPPVPDEGGRGLVAGMRNWVRFSWLRQEWPAAQ